MTSITGKTDAHKVALQYIAEAQAARAMQATPDLYREYVRVHGHRPSPRGWSVAG